MTTKKKIKRVKAGPDLSKTTTKKVVPKKKAVKKTTAKPKKVPKVKAGAELGKPTNKAKKVKMHKADAKKALD